MGRGVHRTGAAFALALATVAPAVWAALAVLLPGVAAAGEASANLRHTPPESAAFTVAGSDGYRVNVKSERGQVTVVVSRQRPPMATFSAAGRLIPPNRGDYTASTYWARATSEDPSTIDADLGPVGRISVAFHPDGRSHATTVDLSGKTEGCVGATKIVRRLGTFVGTISFHGENGYTAVDLTSAPGSVGVSPFRNCSTRVDHRPGAGTPPKGRTSVSLALDGAGDAPSFYASAAFYAFDAAGPPAFIAISAEALDSETFVFRGAHAVGRPSGFLLDDGASGLRIAPPAPFFGTATYRDGPHSPPSWKGDLAVEFPGLRLPLTGPDFRDPKLIRGST